MILYFDTSALIKMYTDEAGAEITRAAEAEAELKATSLITYAEMRSALARRFSLPRDGRLWFHPVSALDKNPSASNPAEAL